MRRLSALVVSLLLIFVVAPAGVARTIINEHQALTQLVAEWSEDEGDGWYTYGYAYATEMEGEVWIEYYEERGHEIDCEGVPGFEYTATSGYGPGTLEVSRRYAAAHAEGLLEVYTYTESYCFEEPVPENGGNGEMTLLPISLDFTATSSLLRETGAGSFKVPGEWNEHYRLSAVYRSGETLVTFDEEESLAWGFLGRVASRYHSNG